MAIKVTIGDLYKAIEVVKEKSAKSDDEVTKAYRCIISGIKGGVMEKRLASQFMARFFKDMSADLQKAAFNSMSVLCVDADASIRKQVLRDFPLLCKGQPLFTGKSSELLVQMLGSEDSEELACAVQSLQQLMDYNAKDVITEICNQIMATAVDSNDALKVNAIKFLNDYFKSSVAVNLKPDAESVLVEAVKKMMKTASEDEFGIFMNILSHAKCMSTVTGRQQLVEIITERVTMMKDFKAVDLASVKRIKDYAEQTCHCLSKNVHADKFLIFFCDKVIPKLSEIPRKADTQVTVKDGAVQNVVPDSLHLQILRCFTQLVSHHGVLNLSERQASICTCLVKLLPKMLTDDIAMESKESEIKNKLESFVKQEQVGMLIQHGAVQDILHCAEVECLLLALHSLCRISMDYFTSNDNVLKTLRLGLQIFARRSQSYSSALDSSKNNKEQHQITADEKKSRFQVIKMLSNITTMIKDFFKHPPNCKSEITASFEGNIILPQVKKIAAAQVVKPAVITGPVKTVTSVPAAKRRVWSSSNGFQGKRFKRF